ncbi:hypothetical protein PMAYCL1PPCAC_31496, partial [Pristionchus mayeri]
SLSSMEIPGAFACRSMVPALLIALSHKDHRMAADAARALKVFTNSADTEYLKNEYGEMMKQLKIAITACPKMFANLRLVNLLACVANLVKAVGKEAFRKDAREILTSMCEACPSLFPHNPVFIHVPPMRDPARRRVDDNWATLDADWKIRIQLLGLLSFMIDCGMGVVAVPILCELQETLRDLSIYTLARWEEVPSSRVAHACQVVIQDAQRSVYKGYEVKTTDLLLDIARRCDDNANVAVDAVVEILWNLRYKTGPELRTVWEKLWKDVFAIAMRNYDSENPDDLVKLLGFLEAIVKCIPAVGSHVLEKDYKEVVELMKE